MDEIFTLSAALSHKYLKHNSDRDTIEPKSMEPSMEPSNKKPKREMTKESVDHETLFEWRDFLAPLLTFCDYQSLTELRATNRRFRTLVEIEVERREQRILAVHTDFSSEFSEVTPGGYRKDYVLKVELGWPERFTNWNSICEEALERADPFAGEGIDYDKAVGRRLLRERGSIYLEDFIEDGGEYDRRLEWNVSVLDFCKRINKRHAWREASEWEEFFDECDDYGRGPVCETMFALLSRARADSLRLSHWTYEHQYKRGPHTNGGKGAIMFNSSDGREVALVWSRGFGFAGRR